MRLMILLGTMPVLAAMLNSPAIALAQGEALEGKAQELVLALENTIPGGPNRIVVENLTYGDTGTAGPFVKPFKAALINALVRSQLFEVLASRSRKGKTGGLNVVAADSPVALAFASDAEAVLYGTYAESGSAVVVRAFVRDLKNLVIASGTVHIPFHQIPPGSGLTPSNLAQAQSAQAVVMPVPRAGGGFRLDLWIDKGNGGLYRSGEKMFVNVRAEMACYLKLVYLDAGGNLIVIFPNAYQRSARLFAGQTVQIPDDQAGFDFEIGEPFGAETLIAFASTEPFPQDAGQHLGNGMILLNQPLALYAQRLRRPPPGGRSVRRAEARVTLTTMP